MRPLLQILSPLTDFNIDKSSESALLPLAYPLKAFEPNSCPNEPNLWKNKITDKGVPYFASMKIQITSM
jgi:hypothetical protein